MSAAASYVASIAQLGASSFVNYLASLLCAAHWHTIPLVGTFACSKLCMAVSCSMSSAACPRDDCGSNQTDGNVRINVLILIYAHVRQGSRKTGDIFTSPSKPVSCRSLTLTFSSSLNVTLFFFEGVLALLSLKPPLADVRVALRADVLSRSWYRFHSLRELSLAMSLQSISCR